VAKIKPDEEFIKKNYETTIKLIEEASLGGLIDGLGERYAICPASSRKEYYSSFPGGLAYHNLFVRFWMQKFADLMAPGEITPQSITKLSLLHEIGKVGTTEEDYYTPQESDWHRERGIYYEVNPNLQYMKIPQRSLFLAQQHLIPLTQDEYLAILLHDGQHDEANKAYKFKEPKLAVVLQTAVQWARKLEKENTVLWPE
jgi:hypothetical protein